MVCWKMQCLLVLLCVLSTDPVKGAVMLKDLQVLAGNAGLGQATASPSHCWAFLDLYLES